MQNNPFLEVMDAHPDRKLKEIVESKRGDYQPDAVAAAEMVLRKRNVKFKSEAPDEIIQMTIEEIGEDIIKRRQQGETLREIRIDYRSKGIEIDDMESGEQNIFSPGSKSFLLIMAIVLSILVVVIGAIASYKGRGNFGGLVAGLFSIWIGGIMLYLRHQLHKKRRGL